MTSNGDWPNLLHEFRRLGGTADNICLRKGRFGKGIFPLDPSLPVLIRVPENLLLPVAEATFRDNKFRVAWDSRMGNAEKAWLEHYMENYSWGDGGRADVERFFGELSEYPEPLRETLANTFSIPCYVEPSNPLIQKRFLRTRAIDYENRKVLMPLVELINHGPHATYDRTDGITVGGTFADEILVRYGGYDPLLMFQNWGFASPEPIAVSLPVSFDAEIGRIDISNDVMDGELRAIPEIRLSVRMPKLTAGESGIKVSFLLLGWKGLPRIPKGAFRHLFREAGWQISDEPFEQLQYTNRLRFLELLADLEDLEGDVANTLRTMCRYQLESLTHSFGVREF